jgi:hypothetical protein
MIKTEIITLNNIQYRRTYSDIGLKIERDGARYGEAVDPIDTNRIYTEIEGTAEDISGDELLEMLEAVL